MFKEILAKLDGWKTILAYAAVHIFGAYPLLLGAINEVIANPKNKAAIIELLIQAALAFGVLDRLRKNLKGNVKAKK